MILLPLSQKKEKKRRRRKMKADLVGGNISLPDILQMQLHNVSKRQNL